VNDLNNGMLSQIADFFQYFSLFTFLETEFATFLIVLYICVVTSKDQGVFWLNAVLMLAISYKLSQQIEIKQLNNYFALSRVFNELLVVLYLPFSLVFLSKARN